jgi:hypothetical protein
MTAVVIAILTMTVVGLLVTIALDPAARGAILLGMAVLYGGGAVLYALLLLSVLHIDWTAASAMIALLAIGAAAWIAARRGSRAAGTTVAVERTVKPHVLDAVTAILAAGYVAYMTVASLWEWDFWAIWGLKARVFLDHGSIDWAWLGSHWHDFAHPDYPVLVPLNYVLAGLLNGSWSDRWLGLFQVAWAFAALLVVRALTAAEAPNWVSAAATAASAIVAMSRYAGMAEGALIAFAGVGLLFLRKAMRDDNPIDWRHGALLLGLAANCKNEGIALLAVTAIAIVATDPRRWRRVLHLWPAVVLLAPWMLLRAAHALPTDIASGNILGRFLARAAHPGQIFAILGRATVDPWSWAVILLTLLIVPRAVQRERFIVIVTALQIATYVATYFVTPNDVTWHIMTSWQRLTRQVQIPITVACIILLAQFAAGGEDARHAEARSEQQ